MKFEPTGDPELDALFATATPAIPRFDLEVLSEETPEYSSEPIKDAPGAIQNSGLAPDPTGGVLVPVMTEGELSENRPTFGKPMRRVKPPRGVGQETFLTLLSNSYALYVRSGSYDNERLQQATGLAPGIIAKTCSSPEFKAAMRLRGVHPAATGLTREQELVLQALSDPSDGKTLQQKLKTVGVTYAKYRAWLQQPSFRDYLNHVTEGMTAHNADALVQLERLVGEGDLKAIQYKLEMNGRYNPGQQQQVDLMALMSKILEIITTHVQNPEVLSGIAQDLGQVASDLKIGPRQIGA